MAVAIVEKGEVVEGLNKSQESMSAGTEKVAVGKGSTLLIFISYTFNLRSGVVLWGAATSSEDRQRRKRNTLYITLRVVYHPLGAYSSFFFSPL